MTGTSALLGWMDPTTPQAADTRTLHVVLEDARRAVADDITLVRGRWSGVAVLAGRVVEGPGRYLAAKAPSTAAYHFEIDPAGHVRRTRDWVEQNVFPDDAGSIRVHILRHRADTPMSRAQWDSVRALVNALRECPASAGQGFPVRLDATWGGIYGLAPDRAIEIGPLVASLR